MLQGQRTDAESGLQIDDRGLVIGNDFILTRNEDGAPTGVECARLLSLLAIAYRHPICPKILHHLDAATKHWRQGDKALAHIRLNFSGLSRLADPTTSDRLRLADCLLDRGMSPLALLTALDLGPTSNDVQKHQYHHDQPRVPAGNGRESGRWVAFWHAITTWLNEPVPEYDHDTGAQVGTRTRARAIATNPLTVGIVGAASLLGVEATLVAEETLVGGADATMASAVEDPSLAALRTRGLASQERGLQELGLQRNTKAVTTAEGRSIPDALTEFLSVEFKDSAKVSLTKQLRIQTEAARVFGRESILVTGENTRVSARTLKAFDQVLRRPYLGPK